MSDYRAVLMREAREFFMESNVVSQSVLEISDTKQANFAHDGGGDVRENRNVLEK
jgi:hypothetical protein